jgi:hypothetical protein
MTETLYWGVDTLMQSHSPVGGVGGKKVYQFVVDHCHHRPSFWGRYIAGVNKEYLLTKEEIEFLSKRDCFILLIYKVQQSNLTLGSEQGNADASSARKAAESLEIEPKDTWIYADIEPDSAVGPDWLYGWMFGMRHSPWGGAGGFYAPTGNPGFNKTFCSALAATEQGRGKPGSPGYRPPIPDVREKVRVYALWPHKTFKPDENPTAQPFIPDKPVCLPDGVVIWQYDTNLFTKDGCNVDVDLATRRGLSSMYYPPSHEHRAEQVQHGHMHVRRANPTAAPDVQHDPQEIGRSSVITGARQGEDQVLTDSGDSDK